MSSSVGSVGKDLVNPLLTNRTSKMSLDPDTTQQMVPVKCVASLTTPGLHRRSKSDQWKPINPPDPNDKDFDRSNVKIKVDDKRVLRPNLSDDSDEDDDASDTDGSSETNLTEDGDEDLTDTDSLAESTRSGEEKGGESKEEEDGSETESHSDDDKSDSSSDSDNSSRQRPRSLRRDCASDDEVDGIWDISNDVLKIKSVVRNTSDDVLRISESGERFEEDETKLQEKLKSESEELLIFGRIREPERANKTPTQATKERHQFPRGTKKFNPCHIDRNFYRKLQPPKGCAGPCKQNYPAVNRSIPKKRMNKRKDKSSGPSSEEKLGQTPRQTTEIKVNLSQDYKPDSSFLNPLLPATTLQNNQEEAPWSNQNNNKPITYADVCRRNQPNAAASKPSLNMATPPPTTTAGHPRASLTAKKVCEKVLQSAAFYNVPSASKKYYSDSEVVTNVSETPPKLTPSLTTIGLSKEKEEVQPGEPVLERRGENAKNPILPEIRDQDPAILSVSESPPCRPALLEHPPPECPLPRPLSNYSSPSPGAPLFPPQYMAYANPHVYSNYLYSVLNQLSPQDMLMIFYEIKMLEAMNASLIQPPAPNTL